MNTAAEMAHPNWRQLQAMEDDLSVDRIWRQVAGYYRLTEELAEDKHIARLIVRGGFCQDRAELDYNVRYLMRNTRIGVKTRARYAAAMMRGFAAREAS